MNSDDKKRAESKKKYVFFSNPDIVIKRAQTSIAATQGHQFFHLEQQQEKDRDINTAEHSEKLKTYENLLYSNPVAPHPFTFITAVKRKLAASGHPVTKKDYDSNQETAIQKNEIDTNTERKHSIPQASSNMDFIKPLKVPDLKISPKTLDYSSRDSSSTHDEASGKFEIHSKDIAQKEDKASKNIDRIQRKLDFSLSSASSILNSGNIEPLKTPDISICTSVTKKKEHPRDILKEKENRSKKMKKDDFSLTKGSDEVTQDKKTRNVKQIHRKDSTDVIVGKVKNERFPSRVIRDSELASKKPKTKSFTMSTVRKDDDRRNRYFATQSLAKLARDKSSESKNKLSNNESVKSSEISVKSQEKIAIKDLYKAASHDIERLYREDAQFLSLSRQSDQSISERSQKQQIKMSSKEQSKKLPEKLKQTISKMGPRNAVTPSEISEDVNTSSMKQQSFTLDVSSQSKSVRGSDNQKYKESSPRQSTRKIDDSSISRTNVANSTQEETTTKESHDDLSLDALLDPRRISFRDEASSPQPEFSELVTPDANLILRMKKRKQILQDDVTSKGLKHKSMDGVEEDKQLVHPTALHMQFQAELNLLDSFNESLRQVSNVENCLYNAKQGYEKDFMQKQRIINEEPRRHLSNVKNNKEFEKKTVKNFEKESLDPMSIAKRDVEVDSPVEKASKSVKVVEVQTQTANDMATQTETLFCPHVSTGHFEELPDDIYRRNSLILHSPPRFSMESVDQSGDLEKLEEISLPSKMRAMSEISLHETTSSIKTETGTEISISTRDVTCSFNKYLDLEMAQLIKDEKQRYDKIEMLFKSREKTLNDRTKKLVKLEEQKRALRDAGQDSQISSVKKKQRALLLKLQQEKDEMNRLKELHKIASQERKLMLQKQRDMFNPEMSTKNILTKLKRSADNQSPRRLSGPMRGYDIRSNSSMSSLVDSDRSQLERSQLDMKHVTSDASSQKDVPQQLQKPGDENHKLLKFDAAGIYTSSQDENAKPTYEWKPHKFEERMPRTNFRRLKDILDQRSDSSKMIFPENERSALDSDDLVEELLKKSKLRSDKHLSIEKDSGKKSTHCSEVKTSSKRKSSRSQKKSTSENFPKTKSDHQLLEDLIIRHHGKRSKIDSSDENYQNSILEEVDFNESQSSLQALLKHSKDVKEKNCQLLKDIANEQEAKESASVSKICKKSNMGNHDSQNEDNDMQNTGNISTRSQVSTFTISHHSSGDSEKSFSRSVVIRAQDPHFKNSKKLEQILNAREASRRSCVEEWIAWHAKLREEENRVARMEQAALKLVSAASKALSYHDTTVSSDTSDVEGRIEELTKKLADRRLEMARLKKEARRQAKQRLRALEANLLNQIKKYDTTIDEMRKKLETKRSIIKDSEKLAIESKSVTDFKVPEIPIKKIQEIYKSSDLLRSKSEPVLMLKVDATLRTVDNDGKSEVSINRKTSEDRSPRQDTPNGSYITSDSEELLTQHSNVYETRTSKSSNASEEMQSEINTFEQTQAKKTTDDDIDEAISYKSQDSISSDKKLVNPSLQEMTEHIETIENSDSSQIFSRNLSSIQFHNKDLNKNINTLENDLRSLSEMMSQFSKKSNEKLKSIRLQSQSIELSGKNTSAEISKKIPAETVATDDKVNTELLETHSVDNDTTITEVFSTVSSSKKDIDFEAQSKEILNEIEKSIISDCVKKVYQEPQPSQLTFEVGMQNLYKENDALSKDLNSLEADIESISDMISKVIKSKNSIEEKSETTHDDMKEQKSLTTESQISEVEEALEKSMSLESDFVKTVIDSPEISEVNECSSIIPENITATSIECNSKIITGNSERRKIIDFFEESAASLHDLKETNVDSSHEFDATRDAESSGQHSVGNDWVTSESFEIQKLNDEAINDRITESNIDGINVKPEGGRDIISEIEEVSSFIPEGESTNIEHSSVPLENTRIEDNVKSQNICESDINLDQTTDKVVYEKKEHEETNLENDTEKAAEIILNLENFEKDSNKSIFIENIIEDTELEKSASQRRNSTNLSPEMNVSFSIEVEEEQWRQKPLFIRLVPHNLVISELEPNSLDGYDLPELDINAKVELVEDAEQSESEISSNRKTRNDIEITECLETVEEQDSSEGEQMDNLIEVAESGLETLERAVESFHDTVYSTDNDEASEKHVELMTQVSSEIEESEDMKNKVVTDKTFDVLREAEYSDISEESLEVSEILERSESKKRPRGAPLPEKYEPRQKSDEVLRILVELSKTSSSKLETEEENQKNDNDGLSESSEGVETPRGVSEIEMDSPRDSSEVKADVETVDDDVQGDNQLAKKETKKTEFHTPTIVSPSEKDIEAMIDKLQASLEQPGLEKAEWEAKLLRIKQLQIELEIKKLEAEEVSYYVREIPNKPPPPYTPPGTGKTPVSHSSPSPPPAVVPSNIDELTAFTDKATRLIYKAKQAGEDIMSLEVPAEICELSKDNNEVLKRDRKVYNTFLFDLCKEIIVGIYNVDDEKPGPSWTKPDVQTKTAMKVPQNFEELNECVSKEVALLFGFKTKLQRENMVMRWSRKRRDRVDEVLAREAQAEEDEWTKFHHDELTVKNELTVAILDTILMETANVVKTVYAKKRKIMV